MSGSKEHTPLRAGPETGIRTDKPPVGTGRNMNKPGISQYATAAVSLMLLTAAVAGVACGARHHWVSVVVAAVMFASSVCDGRDGIGIVRYHLRHRKR